MFYEGTGETFMFDIEQRRHGLNLLHAVASLQGLSERYGGWEPRARRHDVLGICQSPFFYLILLMFQACFYAAPRDVPQSSFHSTHLHLLWIEHILNLCKIILRFADLWKIVLPIVYHSCVNMAYEFGCRERWRVPQLRGHPMTERVQIPAYTDRWMMGDRYGAVVKITKQRKSFSARAIVSADGRGTYVEVAHVKLDKSGKTLRFVLADCTPV